MIREVRDPVQVKELILDRVRVVVRVRRGCTPCFMLVSCQSTFWWEGEKK